MNEHSDESSSAKTSSPYRWVVASSVLFLLLVFYGIYSLSSPAARPSDALTANTQLALSPNGQRLLVTWIDTSEKFHARLVELDGAKVVSVREIALPKNTFTTAFSNNNDQLLLTTLEGRASELYQYDLHHGKLSLIYKSKNKLRFPLEVKDDDYVFLEGQDPDNQSNQWQRYRLQQKTLLNNKNYRAAAPLGVIDGALFILEPWSPPAFRNLSGDLPKGLSALIDNTTFWISCADATSLICLRSHLLYTKEIIHYKDSTKEIDGSSYSTKEIFNGKARCDIPGRWLDSSENQISRNGSTVVFHAAIGTHSGPRAIYVVKNEGANCVANLISLNGRQSRTVDLVERSSAK